MRDLNASEYTSALAACANAKRGSNLVASSRYSIARASLVLRTLRARKYAAYAAGEVVGGISMAACSVTENSVLSAFAISIAISDSTANMSSSAPLVATSPKRLAGFGLNELRNDLHAAVRILHGSVQDGLDIESGGDLLCRHPPLRDPEHRQLTYDIQRQIFAS